jgi:peptidyl-prolyl cis-trans isomerase SurA
MTPLSLLAFCIAASGADDAIIIDRVVAVVDRAVVLQSEVDTVVEQLESAMPIPAGVDKDAVRRERRGQILETLIAEKLLEAEVRKLRIDVTDAEVERTLAGLMRENGLTEETLSLALARQGMTLAEFKAQKKKELTKMKIVQLKVRSRVNVTDDDVKAAQKQAERTAKAQGFTKVRARHILYLVPQGQDGAAQQQRADDARRRLDAGADFAALAAAESEDPGSKQKGGELGAFGRGEMVPEFEKAAFEAPVGKVVGPIRSSFGWHVIRVDERVSPDTFNKVRARHILYLVPQGESGDEQMKKALAGRARLSKGEDFALVASEESEDPGSKPRGGDLGTFGRGEMVPEFEKAAFESPVGKVVGPVRSPFGWHLIRVEERVTEGAKDPDKALDDLRNRMFSKELEVQFEQYLDELRRDAFVEKRL